MHGYNWPINCARTRTDGAQGSKRSVTATMRRLAELGLDSSPAGALWKDTLRLGMIALLRA